MGQKSALQFSENGVLSIAVSNDSAMETERAATPRLQANNMTPGEKTSLWMNVGGEKKKTQGLLLIRHNLCVFPMTTTRFQS